MRFHQAESLVPAPVFNEVLAIEGEQASVLAAYASDYYAGQPAVTLDRRGQGRVAIHRAPVCRPPIAPFHDETALDR